MDKFFTQTTCDRCGGSLTEGRIMSMINDQCICMKCKKEELNSPIYTEKREQEHAQIKMGNYNFHFDETEGDNQ